jgi:putative membrane protein
MKYPPIATIFALSALLIGTVGAQQNEANRLKSADRAFVTKAAQGGLAEVELGNLATQKDLTTQKAANDKVKHFGQQMVTDHSKANDALKLIAVSEGITLPTGLDSKADALKTRLSGLNGADFDRAYMENMVKDHKEDIAEFQKEADHGTDQQIKEFALKTLPTLQHHLQMAQDALSEVKK